MASFLCDQSLISYNVEHNCGKGLNVKALHFITAIVTANVKLLASLAYLQYHTKLGKNAGQFPRVYMQELLIMVTVSMSAKKHSPGKAFNGANNSELDTRRILETRHSCSSRTIPFLLILIHKGHQHQLYNCTPL